MKSAVFRCFRGDTPQTCSLFVLYYYEKPQEVTESPLFEICCKWLCYAVFLIFREDTNKYGGFSIPERHR